MTTQWYWCLTHQQVESGDDRDDPDNSLGPYPTPDEARDWRERADDRIESWKRQDEEWFGEPGEEPGDEPNQA